MINKIKTAIGYWLLWICFFEIARLIFSIYNIRETQTSGILNISKSYLFGLKMDVSTSSYILVPFCLILLINIYIKGQWVLKITKIYSTLLIAISLIIIFCDLPLYAAWGNRLDVSPLKYLQSPKEFLASISHLPLFWFGLVWFGLV